MNIPNNRKNWRINDYIESLIMYDEIAGEVPGADNQRELCKAEIKYRFTQQERKEAGLVF